MAGLVVLPKGGTAYTHTVLSYVAARADKKTGTGWSSIATVARTVPAAENTVRSEMRRLNGWGAITVTDWGRPGRGHAHHFIVHRDWLVRHLPNGKPSPGEPFPAAEKVHPATLKGSPGEDDQGRNKGTYDQAAVPRRGDGRAAPSHEVDRPSPVAARERSQTLAPGIPREQHEARQAMSDDKSPPSKRKPRTVARKGQPPPTRMAGDVLLRLVHDVTWGTQRRPWHLTPKERARPVIGKCHVQ